MDNIHLSRAYQRRILPRRSAADFALRLLVQWMKMRHRHWKLFHHSFDTRDALPAALPPYFLMAILISDPNQRLLVQCVSGGVQHRVLLENLRLLGFRSCCTHVLPALASAERARSIGSYGSRAPS